MITFQSSSFIDYISTDFLKATCNVQMKDGSYYTYNNVSRRAILNLNMNPNMSLGKWFNNNLDKAERVTGRLVFNLKGNYVFA
jgi:hypothetical protein